MKTGLLLLQLGTPSAPTPAAVRRYLRAFLGDPRVLDMPAAGRWLLLHAVILPLRPRRSAQAYRAIWQGDAPGGSPLLLHSLAQRQAVAEELGDGWEVELGMRYGEPAIGPALGRLLAAGSERVVVLPLFPQYAGSSTGSALEETFRQAGARWNVPSLRVVAPFYDDPGFVEAVAGVAREPLAAFEPEHVLLSYHGLPERQIRRSDPSGLHCLASPTCCDAMVAANRSCYRAQCAATSRALAAVLGLAPGAHSMAFQSRLGRTPWIRPYTDVVLGELARRGVRRLAVLCPSFVADCLETLEEIGIRGREQWRALGGEELLLVPCVNADRRFVRTVARLARDAA